MKNQYFGDIGDYGKYGLLKFLGERDVKIAVNWYLTKDEKNKPGDGKFTDYLEQENERKYSKYDPDLFTTLKEMVLPEPKNRDVKQFERKNAIPSAIYYHGQLNLRDLKTAAERKAHRDEWHRKALITCEEADLVFLDPDNGLMEKPKYTKTAEKYIFPCEVAAYYKRGQNVVYYCHKGRRKPDPWESYKQYMMHCLPDASFMGLTFHRGTQRSYIFICHPEQAEQYRSLLSEFLKTEWGGANENKAPFTEERTEGFVPISI